MAALTAGLAVVALVGCASSSGADGDALAQDSADAVSRQIASHSDNTTEVTLLEMVDYWIPAETVYVGQGAATVEPLAWSGAIGSESTATIDVRIDVVVDAHSSSQIFGPSNSAGAATRCYRLVWGRYDPASRTEIACPDTPAPARPTPEPRPELTDDDRVTVSNIVAATSDRADIESALHEAFPQQYIRIETATVGDEVVVALGIPRERDCILVVRDGGGEIGFPSYDRIWLEPGELGCSTALYTSPPL